MKKEKKNNKFLVAVVALVLLAVGVGYAALERNYTLNGSAEVKGNSWKITTPSDPQQVCPEGATCDTVTTDVNEETGDVTVTYTANLDKPGDVYTLTIPVENGGVTAAKVTKLTGADLASAIQGKTEEEITAIAKYLDFQVTGIAMDETVNGKDPDSGDATVKNVVITVKYKDDQTAQDNLPETGLSATFKTEFGFGQA